MATFQSELVAGNTPLSAPVDGSMICRYGRYTAAANLAAVDVIQMIPVYKGEVVHDIKIRTADLDTNGAPAIVLSVGDGDDTNRYINGSTVAQAGGNDDLDAGVRPYQYAADDTIDVDVDTAAATGAAGLIEVWAYITGKE